MESSHLDFRPITKGLGFHNDRVQKKGKPSIERPLSPPPWRPEKERTPRPPSPPISYKGSGAIAAGQPKFAFPEKIQKLETPPAVSRVSPALERSSLEERYGYAYVFKRILAYGLDSLLNLGVAVGAFSILVWKLGLPAQEFLKNSEILFVTVLFLLFFNWAMTAAEEILFGTSFGKRSFGLKIEGDAIPIFLRSFFFLVSVGFAGLGLLTALLNRRKRCWHDSFVDLQPVERAHY